MTVDISKIKPGDKVTLVPLSAVAVISNDKDHVWASTCEGFRFPLLVDDIAAHHPAPREFQVGDRVFMTDRGMAHAGTVRGVDMPDLWVRWDATFMYRPICRAADLTLVEAGQ